MQSNRYKGQSKNNTGCSTKRKKSSHSFSHCVLSRLIFRWTVPVRKRISLKPVCGALVSPEWTTRGRSSRHGYSPKLLTYDIDDAGHFLLYVKVHWQRVFDGCITCNYVIAVCHWHVCCRHSKNAASSLHTHTRCYIWLHQKRFTHSKTVCFWWQKYLREFH